MQRLAKLPLNALTAISLLLLSSAAAAQSVNVYSARHYDSDEALYQAFTKRTGIEVNTLQGNSDQLIQRIKRAGSASPADVLITVDAGRLWRAEEAGIFQPVSSDVLNRRIPERLRHPEGLWFGFSQRLRLIFYNKENFDPEALKTYGDLADERYRDQICIRSSSNVYNQSLLASIIAAKGADGARQWAQGLVANLARPPQGGDTTQIRGVAAGECEIGVANHYYYVRMALSDNEDDRDAAAKVGLIFPNQDGRGVHANVGGAGVVAGAPHRQAAVRLLEFLASDEAQRLFAKGNDEYPVVDSVAVHNKVMDDWPAFKIDDVNVSKLGHNNPVAVRIMDEVGWR